MNFLELRRLLGRPVDPQHAKKVSETTFLKYQSALEPFYRWLCKQGVSPSSAEDWDDCIVEYKQTEKLKKASFEKLVAALEFAIPRCKGNLEYARGVISGWGREHETKHTVPITGAPSKLAALHMSAAGAPRLGVGLVLQQRKGLRPNEMLMLQPEDVVNPMIHISHPGQECLVLNLGMRVGTKAKRAQSVVIRKTEDPSAYEESTNPI